MMIDGKPETMVLYGFMMYGIEFTSWYFVGEMALETKVMGFI
jgi:hypothetical protein